MSARPRLTWAVLCVVAGIGCQLTSWVLTIPPFGSYDEFDHAFRASAVAHGQLVAPPSQATRGTGAMVLAGSDVVDAARAECLGMTYTQLSDCIPARTTGGDLVEIPTGAGRYSPIYYAVVGWAGLPLHGRAGLLAERVVSGAVCLGVLLASGLVLRRWPRPDLALRALVVAVSPMVVFSVALMAPNGLEMVCGAGWWVALLTLARVSDPPRLTWWLLAVSGCLLATLRGLGPLWLALATAIALVTLRRAEWAASNLRQQRRAALTSAGSVAVALVLAVIWTLSQRSLVIGRDPAAGRGAVYDGLVYATWTAPINLIQVVTAIPGRGSPPPSLTLAGWIIAFGLIVVPSFLAGDRRARLACALLLGAIVVVPLAIESATYAQFGRAWQGRYVLPLAIGLPLLAVAGVRGRAEAAGQASPWRRSVVDTVVTLLATAAAQVAVLQVGTGYWQQHSPSYQGGDWPWLSLTETTTLMLGGSLLLGLGLLLVVLSSARAEPAGADRPAWRTTPVPEGHALMDHGQVHDLGQQSR